jgi:hypothetical protein
MSTNSADIPSGSTTPPAQDAGANGTTSLDNLLLAVRTVGNGLQRASDGITNDRLYDTLGAVHRLLEDGQDAITKVQAEIAAHEPVVVVMPDPPVMPAWRPRTSPHSYLQDVWRLLEPFLDRVVARLPGNSPGEQALRQWAVNCLAHWEPLVEQIGKLLKPE